MSLSRKSLFVVVADTVENVRCIKQCA